MTADTPYSWFQALLVMRGLEIGLVFQPLMRAALVRIPEKQIAILSSFLQTQQQVHYTHLAEQSVPGTPKGREEAALQDGFRLTLWMLLC